MEKRLSASVRYPYGDVPLQDGYFFMISEKAGMVMKINRMSIKKKLQNINLPRQQPLPGYSSTTRKMKTIRGSLIFSQCCILLILTFLLGFSIYTYTCEVLKTRNRKAYDKILDSAEVIMDHTLSYYKDVSRLILENGVVQRELRSGKSVEGDGIFMDNRLFQVLGDELNIYANGVGNIDSLYLFDNEGKIFYVDSKIKSMDVRNHMDYESIQKTDWYWKAMGAEGKEIFIGYNVLKDDKDTFSCVKVLNTLDKQEKIGLLVLNIRCDALNTVFKSNTEEEDVYGIFYHQSGERRLVYQSGCEKESGKAVLADILENKEQDYEVTNHICQIENWEMLHIVRKSDIFREAKQIRLLIIILGMGATLVMAAVTIHQVYHITRPLYQLREDIRLVGDGRYHFDHSYQTDEVGIIGQEFQKMVQERIALKEQVQEEEIRRQASELELLQSQINPHFLYNTLDTLYWMAIVEDKENIAQLTRALSDVFRISLNQGMELISIREELKFIEDYLYIQNIRFDGKFMTRLQIDEQVYDWKIIKLIIQPFVENAIYHGLEPKMDSGSLQISGRVEDRSLVIAVEDDGVGMDAAADMKKGYAMQNVMERVRLHYGENAKIEVESRSGYGTKIRLYLPVEKIKTDTLEGGLDSKSGKQ
ncbi:MAG: sensor histidine kinase [Ruminococcus sp.]|nr:sensor histidine kinase [Ruminococcus sp.]